MVLDVRGIEKRVREDAESKPNSSSAPLGEVWLWRSPQSARRKFSKDGAF